MNDREWKSDARAERPRRARKQYRGGFRLDGSWKQNVNEVGMPLDPLTARIDSLVAARRRLDRRYSPRDFALRIQTHHADLMSNEGRGIFLRDMIDQWLELDTFDRWPSAPCETHAEHAIRDAGYGERTAWAGGRAVDVRQVIHEDKITVPPGFWTKLAAHNWALAQRGEASVTFEQADEFRLATLLGRKVDWLVPADDRR